MRVCMGVPTRIVMYAEMEEKAEEAAAAAFARIAALDAMMSDYRRDSDLNRLCEEGAAGWVAVPEELVEILRLAARLSEASEGAFDISVGPAVALWRDARRTGRMPPAERVEAARALIDWRGVDVRPGAARVAKAGMKLDLGGIAKGYAAQRGVEVLREMGYPRAMVALAGDIVVGDPPPGEKGWRVAVVGERTKEEEAKGKRPLVLVLRNAGVSTSGDAEQFVEVDGARYSHIVDPRTGVGMTAVRQVTVVAGTGEEADALATAACVMGGEAARAMLERWGVKGVVVEEGGRREMWGEVVE